MNASQRHAMLKKRFGRAHPGFAAVQGSIASREGISQDRAGAILAAATRRASPAAMKRNPRLRRVKRKKHR